MYCMEIKGMIPEDIVHSRSLKEIGLCRGASERRLLPASALRGIQKERGSPKGLGRTSVYSPDRKERWGGRKSMRGWP